MSYDIILLIEPIEKQAVFTNQGGVNLEILIEQAQMNFNKEDGYIGKVEFRVEGHKQPYEITLFSKRGKEWMYSLNFLHEAGDEEEIMALEEFIEEDDECFDGLIAAAKAQIVQN